MNEEQLCCRGCGQRKLRGGPRRGLMQQTPLGRSKSWRFGVGSSRNDRRGCSEVQLLAMVGSPASVTSRPVGLSEAAFVACITFYISAFSSRAYHLRTRCMFATKNVLHSFGGVSFRTCTISPTFYISLCFYFFRTCTFYIMGLSSGKHNPPLLVNPHFPRELFLKK